MHRLNPLTPLLVILLLTGCAPSGPAREDAYYRLSPLTPQSRMNTPLGETVLINRLENRGFSGGRNITFWEPTRPREMQRYSYHYWVEPPAVLLQDTLSQFLRDAGVGGKIATPSQRIRADYTVTGNLLRMEHRLEPGRPHVVVELELGLTENRRRELLMLKRYLVEEDAGNNRIDSAVTAFGRALERLLSQFVSDIEANRGDGQHTSG